VTPFVIGIAIDSRILIHLQQLPIRSSLRQKPVEFAHESAFMI